MPPKADELATTIFGLTATAPGLLEGWVTFLGVDHKIKLARVKREVDREDNNQLYHVVAVEPGQPHDEANRVLDAACELDITDGLRRTVTLPGYPGDWVLVVYPPLLEPH